MFEKSLIANRADNGPQVAAAKPNCVVRGAHAGEFPAETHHV